MSPLSMPCVVPFSDQALHLIGMGDRGLVLTEHSQFHLLMQEHLAQSKERASHPFPRNSSSVQCQKAS